jgi:hypothetical protein
MDEVVTGRYLFRTSVNQDDPERGNFKIITDDRSLLET